MGFPGPRRKDKRVPRARKLRRDMTDAERKLWLYLRLLPLEKSHFRRQRRLVPILRISPCHEKRLIIEVDGGQHNLPAQAAADAARTEYLTAQGYRVLRFWNNEGLQEIEGVMTVILEALSAACPPPPTPPHHASRGGRGEAETRLNGTRNEPDTVQQQKQERPQMDEGTNPTPGFAYASKDESDDAAR
jgi:very-short-patch-repair endonuclease